MERLADYIDSDSGFRGVFKTDGKPGGDGLAFGTMISGGTDAAMRGAGEWVKLSDLSFRN